MQIYNDEKKRVGTLSGYKNRAIVTTLDSGDKELSFEYPADGKMVSLLREEYYIRTKTDEYVLKATEKGEKYNRYTASLNVEELEGLQYPYGFESHEQTIRECLRFAFEGTGWTIGTCTVLKRRTIVEEESVSAWDVLQKALNTYRCECTIDTLNKVVNIYEQIGSDKGCYFVEGLNLRKLTVKSDTYEFFTRIYPIGKDGITPDFVLGQAYIENFQYSKKVKAYVWKDERYTDVSSLIEDATAKLEELSRPYVAFEAEVADLAKMSVKHKDILSYGIGDKVTLISKRKKTRERQRIVRITEYPETPGKNTVEISNARKTFTQMQKEETDAAKASAISVSKNSTKKILADYPTTETVDAKIAAGDETVELSVKKTLENYYDKDETEAVIEVSVGQIESRVETTEGEVTALKQTAGTVSVEAKSEQGTLSTFISNDGTWKTAFVDANGKELSGLSFDFVKKEFVFKGSGSFSGDLNIGDGKFVVDEYGNLTSKGKAEIRGGKFYALNDDGSQGDCFEITPDGLQMYRPEDLFDVVSINKNEGADGKVYPSILLNSEGSEDGLSNFPCKIQRFADGLWIGNVFVTMYENGSLKTMDDGESIVSNGVFVSLVDGMAYVVLGNNRKNIYTGDTIARFG